MQQDVKKDIKKEKFSLFSYIKVGKSYIFTKENNQGTHYPLFYRAAANSQRNGNK